MSSVAELFRDASLVGPAIEGLFSSCRVPLAVLHGLWTDTPTRRGITPTALRGRVRTAVTTTSKTDTGRWPRAEVVVVPAAPQGQTGRHEVLPR
jgi:hypothetical protein